MPKLVLTFVTDAGNRVSLSVPAVKENLTEAQVTAAMNAVITADIFKPKGLSLVGIHSAKIVDSTTTFIIEAA